MRLRYEGHIVQMRQLVNLRLGARTVDEGGEARAHGRWTNTGTLERTDGGRRSGDYDEEKGESTDGEERDMRLKLAIMEEQGIMGCVEEYSEPGRFGEVLIAIPCQEAVSDSPFGALDIAFVNKDGVICKAYRKVERGRYLFCEAAIAVLSRVSPDAEWTDEDASLALNVSRHNMSLASVSSDDDPWFKAGDCLHLVRGENDASHQVNWVIYAKEKTTDEELSALQSACV